MGWHPALPARKPSTSGLGCRKLACISLTVTTTDDSAYNLMMWRERQRLKVKHLWAGLAPQWKNLRARHADSPSLLSIADYFTHFEYADATLWEWIRWQERAWHGGEKRRQMCGTTQWWNNNDFSRLKPPGSAEGRTGRGVAPFTSHLGAIVLFCFGLLLFWGGVWFCCLCFCSLHLGFLHGFRLGPIGLLLVYHRRWYDRQSLERARYELKKKDSIRQVLGL